jgi:long-chain acyl-CoA synthetase
MSRFLDERIRELARVAPDAPAAGSPSGWVNYGELAGQIARIAASLRSHGVGPGEYVLNLLPAGVASVAAGFAIQRAGACLVEVNRDNGPDFMVKVARATRARHAFVHTRDLAALDAPSVSWKSVWVPGAAASVPKPGNVETLVGVSLDAHPEEPAGDADTSPTRSLNDAALILFTSASSGEPRGVVLTYRNIAANAESIVEYLRLTAADRVMSILPLSYSYGRSLLNTHMWCGGSILFDHRFMYPRVVLEAIGSQACTGFAGVPLTFELLHRKCDPRSIAMPSLRYVTVAGGGLATDMRRWVRDAFAPATFFVMYGQTEATARLAYLPPERFDEKTDSIGVAIPAVELRVVDDEGRDVAVNEVGNLVARGENVCLGYLDAVEETQDILRDGWLWTGDLARRDADGYFFLVGRKRLMLKVAGYRFAPEEVEGRLKGHPAIAEACVVGVPDELTGEAVWAFVVAGAPVDDAALRRHCAESLPAYKVPRRLVRLDELPKSSAGKLRRAELQEMARRLAEAADCAREA